MQRWMRALREVVLLDGKAQSAERKAQDEPGKGQRAESKGQGASGSDSLPHTPCPLRAKRLVIFIDEIDAVRSLPFSADEFFAGIRECYNRRAEDPRFERLTFCLLGVASPSDLIRDTRLTPFNIGRRIELTDFTDEEADILRIGLEVGDLGTPGRPEKEARALVKRVLYWTGGHPYLTQRLRSALLERGIRDTGYAMRDAR